MLSIWKLERTKNKSNSSITFGYALLPSSSTSRSDIKFTGYEFPVWSAHIFYWQESVVFVRILITRDRHGWLVSTLVLPAALLPASSRRMYLASWVSIFPVGQG